MNVILSFLERKDLNLFTKCNKHTNSVVGQNYRAAVANDEEDFNDYFANIEQHLKFHKLWNN